MDGNEGNPHGIRSAGLHSSIIRLPGSVHGSLPMLLIDNQKGLVRSDGLAFNIHPPRLLDKHRLAGVALAIPRTADFTCRRGSGGSSLPLAPPIFRLVHVDHFVLLSPVRSVGGYCGDSKDSDSGIPTKTAGLASAIPATPASAVAASDSRKFASLHLSRIQAVHKRLKIGDACCHDAHALNDLYYDGWSPHGKHGIVRIGREFVVVHVTHDGRDNSLPS